MNFSPPHCDIESTHFNRNLESKVIIIIRTKEYASKAKHYQQFAILCIVKGPWTVFFIASKFQFICLLTCIHWYIWDRYLIPLSWATIHLELPQFPIYTIFMDIVTLEYLIKPLVTNQQHQQISWWNIPHAPESNYSHNLSKHIPPQCSKLTYHVVVLLNKPNQISSESQQLL